MKANVKRRKASTNNNDIEDVLALNFADSSGSASSSGEENESEIYNDDLDEVREQESSPELESYYDDNKRPVFQLNQFQDLPKSPRLKKELVDIFNRENGYSLENQQKVKFNTSEMWKNFVEQKREEKLADQRKIEEDRNIAKAAEARSQRQVQPRNQREPKHQQPITSSTMYDNSQLADRPAEVSEQTGAWVTQAKAKIRYELPAVIESCRYDPSDPNYIFESIRINSWQIENWNERQFTFFGYNGNYPELMVTALTKRGCWNCLNYKELVKQQLQHQMNKHRPRRDKSILSDQENKGCSPQDNYGTKPNYTAIDETVVDKCNFIWRPVNYYEQIQKKINKRMLKSIVKVEQGGQNASSFIYNHFESTKGIGTKAGLVNSLRQYYYTNRGASQCGYSEFDTTPTTFIIWPKQPSQQLDELQMRFRQIQRCFPLKEKMPVKHCVNNLWLVKPSNANQGRGIQIFTNWAKMLSFINQRPAGSNCIVQKYLERPLLYKNRKFDLRVWAIATSKNELYFYQPGYLRTSSNQYSLDNHNLTVHLTNQCLQVKQKDTYGQHEEGNTLSYAHFQEYLDSEEFKKERQRTLGGPEIEVSVQKDLVPRMKDIVIDTFLAVKNQVNPHHRRDSFELFGYDFMIDEDFRVWLIEVNTNPYLGQPNKWTKKFVADMVDEMFQIVLDPHYPPVDDYFKNHRVKTRNYELIYAEGEISNPDYLIDSSTDGTHINQRRPYSQHLLYPLQNYQVAQNANQQQSNPAELQMLRQKYGVTLPQTQSTGADRGEEARSNSRTKAFQQSSFSRRKRYRPASAVARPRLASPLQSRESKVPESQKRSKFKLDKSKSKDLLPTKAGVDGGPEAPDHIKQSFEELMAEHKKYLESSQQREQEILKSSRSTKAHSKSKSLLGKEDQTYEPSNHTEPSPQAPSTELKDGTNPDSVNGSVDIKCTDKDIEVVEIATKTPRQKTPYVREFDHQNIEPEAALEHFFDFLHPKKSSELELKPSRSSNFEQLRESVDTVIEDVTNQQNGQDEWNEEIVIQEYNQEAPQKPETDSDANKTVIFDDNAFKSTVQENKFHKLVRNQVFDLITQKLCRLLETPAAGRSHADFQETLFTICQNYLVEQSQEEIQDFDEMQSVVDHLQRLISSDVNNSIKKPKCIDILIELLKNENTFVIERLSGMVLALLVKISESEYVASQSPAAPPKAAHRDLRLLNNLIKQSTASQQEGLDQLLPLAQSSLQAKEHLLKSQQIKKLLLVHQKLNAGDKELLEQVLMNLSCTKEARGLSISAQMVEASQLVDTKNGQKNQESQPGEDLAMFKKYSDAYEKCIQNGIVSYMISNECSAKTNQFVIKKVSRQDILSLSAHCEEEPGYLKIILKSIDMANLKSRLRLQQKAVEAKVKAKEKKKEANPTARDKSITRNTKGQPVVQKPRIIEPVRSTVQRDVSINKQRRQYRPATAVPKAKPEKADTVTAKPEPAKATIKQPQHNLIPKRPTMAKSPSKRRSSHSKLIPIGPDKKAAAEPAPSRSLVPSAAATMSKASETTSLPKISTRSSGRSSVKQIQWNEGMNEVSLKSEENKENIDDKENPLDLALEKLEHMKIRLMQKVKKAEGQRASISKNHNYDLESVKTKQYSSIL